MSRPIEQIVADIAAVIVQIGGPVFSRYFLYTEFDDGVCAPTLLQEMEDNLVYLETDPLTNLLFELNDVSDPEPIGALSLDVEGEHFRVKLDYGIELYEGTDERTSAAVRERFGDKPIIYPSLPGRGVEYQHDS